jgi:hypothetical protein
VLHFPRRFFLISVRAQERTEGFLSADFSAQSRVFSPTLLGASFLVSVGCASAKPIGEVSLPQFVLPVSPAFRFDLIFIALEGERAAWSPSGEAVRSAARVPA